MIGYLIKYRDDCPNEKLRNTYYTGKRKYVPGRWVIFDTFDKVKQVLHFVPMKEWAKIIEVEVIPIREYHPTEHFFYRPRGLYYPKVQEGDYDE